VLSSKLSLGCPSESRFVDAQRKSGGRRNAMVTASTMGKPTNTFVPPQHVRMFGVQFGGPHEMRRDGGVIRFVVLASLEGITAAEVMELAAHERLRVGCRLHEGSSTSPIARAAHAAVEVVDDATVRCRFVLPGASFRGQPLRLLHVGMLYEGVGTFEAWGNPGAWMAVGSNEGDVFKQYFDNFNANRA
jgi:hypothetical protein